MKNKDIDPKKALTWVYTMKYVVTDRGDVRKHFLINTDQTHNTLPVWYTFSHGDERFLILRRSRDIYGFDTYMARVHSGKPFVDFLPDAFVRYRNEDHALVSCVMKVTSGL